ncbi:hypothetical protein AGMMS50225_06750 [Betaproteobacteria bacterium]|nr:hypothetical protein AGMMS50225_06750 [Betaproteobacteria bacterium]
MQAWRNEIERTRLAVDELAPLWNRIGESFGGALNGMLTGAQSWRSALSGFFQQVSNAFLQQIVIEPFQQWVAMQARMLALKLGFVQQEQSTDAAASAAKVAQKSAETTATVSMEAAEAGAGAAASQSSIPYVGPALAVAAMVAGVMALLGNVKKFAAGGLVSGPGSATSDSIPARLSAGEFVMSAATVRRVGVDFLQSINGMAAGPRFEGERIAAALAQSEAARHQLAKDKSREIALYTSGARCLSADAVGVLNAAATSPGLRLPTPAAGLAHAAAAFTTDADVGDQGDSRGGSRTAPTPPKFATDTDVWDQGAGDSRGGSRTAPTPFATDADVGQWAIAAREQYDTCRGRIDALRRWSEGWNGRAAQ